jgi:DNA mismatch repair protein MutS
MTGYEDWVFAPETGCVTLARTFQGRSLDGFGLKDRSAAVGAAGAVVHYLAQHLHRDVGHLTRLSFYQTSDFLVLDPTTCVTSRSSNRSTGTRPNQDPSMRSQSHRHPHGRAPAPGLAQPAPRRIARCHHRRQDAVQAICRTDRPRVFRQRLMEVRDLERTVGNCPTW